MSDQPKALWLADALDNLYVNGLKGGAATELRRQHDEIEALKAERDALLEALKYAEAGLADIGDADREPGDDLAWCEARAAEALPTVRAAIDAAKGGK